MNKRSIYHIIKRSVLCGMLLIVAANAHALAPTYANIVYTHSGPPKQNNLDVYVPSQGSQFPVIIYVHGGGWIGGNKNAVGYKADYFTSLGYIFVSINYRLAPKYKHPAQVEDTASAVAWVYGHIAGVGGDPTRIAIMGHSAGADLSALVATDEKYLYMHGLDPSVIKAVVPLDGGDFDLLVRLPELSDMGLKNFIYVFGYAKPVWVDASPINHIVPFESMPAFLMVKAEARNDMHNENFAVVLTNAGHDAQVYIAQGKTHPTVDADLGKVNDSMTQVVTDFLLNNL